MTATSPSSGSVRAPAPAIGQQAPVRRPGRRDARSRRDHERDELRRTLTLHQHALVVPAGVGDHDSCRRSREVGANERESSAIRRPADRTVHVVEHTSRNAAEKRHAPELERTSPRASDVIDEAAIGRHRRTPHRHLGFGLDDLGGLGRRHLPHVQTVSAVLSADEREVVSVRRDGRPLSILGAGKSSDLDVRDRNQRRRRARVGEARSQIEGETHQRTHEQHHAGDNGFDARAAVRRARSRSIVGPWRGCGQRGHLMRSV